MGSIHTIAATTMLSSYVTPSHSSRNHSTSIPKRYSFRGILKHPIISLHSTFQPQKDSRKLFGITTQCRPAFLLFYWQTAGLRLEDGARDCGDRLQNQGS